MLIFDRPSDQDFTVPWKVALGAAAAGVLALVCWFHHQQESLPKGKDVQDVKSRG